MKANLESTERFGKIMSNCGKYTAYAEVRTYVAGLTLPASEKTELLDYLSERMKLVWPKTTHKYYEDRNNEY